MFKQRYRRILWFFAGVFLKLAWWEIVIPAVGLKRWARRTRRERMRGIAASFRVMALRMGGLMIKVGQFLSSRLDVLPREFTDELTGLQDEVEAESFADIRRVVEAEFGERLEDRYLSFEQEPLASASIGQVHKARLKGEDETSGQGVVVKVQRPNIAAIVEVDLRALHVVGRWAKLYHPLSRRVDVMALLDEFSRVTLEEIDYMHEGKNAERFAENFKDVEGVKVPRVYWKHTTTRVLTLEDVQAIKITDYAAIEAAGLDRAEVAVRLFKTYLKQIFEDQFYHADPHPGNLFVQPLIGVDGATGKAWKLIFVDFGMSNEVSATLFEGLRELLVAIGMQDGRRVVAAYHKMDILLPGADDELLAKATNQVFREFWGKTAPEMMDMKSEKAGEFIREFGDLIYEMPFQMPENLVLLVRCLGILSGICSGLDANFNVWSNLAPYAMKVVQGDGQKGIEFWLKQAGEYLSLLAGLPRKMDALVDRAERGDLQIRSPQLERQVSRLEHSVRLLAGTVLLAAGLLAGVQVYLAGRTEVALGIGLVSFLGFVILTGK